MKVLVTTSYDDHKYGEGPTAIVEMPANMTKDEAFVAWIRKNSDLWRNACKTEILRDAMFQWNEYEVRTL